jgi:putative MATE family efflux protein
MTLAEQERRRFLLEEEKVGTALTRLALPSIAGMLVMAFYNLVDGYFIGLLKNVEAQAGVTVGFPLFAIMMAAGQMVGMGGASYISRQLGAKHHHKVEAAVANVIMAVLALTVLVTTALLVWLDPVLLAFGATKVVLPYARDFALPLVIGSGLVIFNMAANALIRAEGNTRTSMRGIMVGAILNCLLGPLFMFAPLPAFDALGWHHSVRGAAWATFFSQLASLLYLGGYLVAGRTALRIRLSRAVWDWPMIKDIAGVGSANFMRQSLMAAAMLFLNHAARLHAAAPEAMLAAVGVAGRLGSLPFYAVIGFLQAYQPFAGYNYGARQFARLREATRISVRFNTLLLLGTTLLTLLFAQPIAHLFLPGHDAASVQALDYAATMLRCMSLTLPLLAFHQVFTSLYQAIGKISGSMVLSVSRNGFFFIPLTWLVPIGCRWILGDACWHGFTAGDLGVMLVNPAADLLAATLTVFMAIRLMRELRNAEQKNAEQKNAELKIEN